MGRQVKIQFTRKRTHLVPGGLNKSTWTATFEQNIWTKFKLHKRLFNNIQLNKRSGEQTVNWTLNIWTLHYQTGNILNKWHEVNDTVEQMSWLNNRLSEQWTIINWTSLIEHNFIKHFLNEQIPFEHWTINNWTNLVNWLLFNWLLFTWHVHICMKLVQG